MLRRLTIVCVFILLSIYFVFPAHAVYDPTVVPNNRLGIHILDPEELPQAAKLVNTSGGDWGYVTVPIRSDDRDRDKWLKFFTSCTQLHVIPVIRLATYPYDGSWVAPSSFDLVDYANFLSDMPWPTQNRYIILFNEPNHAAEWGGKVDPLAYATLLLDAKRIFKSHSTDFFLITAGLDMSAPSNKTSLDALEFYSQMSKYQPDWYQAVDGLSVHAYPNPAFSSSPYSTTRYGILSYRYEIDLLTKFRYPQKPLFITEAGWLYQPPGNFTAALNRVWTDPQIVAITPFLLFAGTGDFAKFSFLDTSFQPKQVYLEYQDYPKVAGSPLLALNLPLPLFSVSLPVVPALPSASFFPARIVSWFSNLVNPTTPTLTINSTTIKIEIADNDFKRARGLSGRKSLPANTGMLFTYDKPDKYTFWMKDMKFALDFIWIYNGQIVDLTQNVPSPDQTNNLPQIITPSSPVNAVLEVPAGFIAKHQLQIGNKVNINN